MKVLLKGLAGIVLGCICLVCASTDIYAGTGIYVGKDVSAEGTTIIGASTEVGVGNLTVPVVIDKGVYKKGDVIECANGYKFTLPDDNPKLTVNRTMSYTGYGEWYNCATNEYGVSVVSTITTYSNADAVAADPFETCGICEEKLALILTASSKTAKEAVDLLRGEYDSIGADTPEIILVADQEEAWLVENFTGHQYVAVKLPADKMATFAHDPVLNTADLKAADTICSAELLTLPVDKGFAVYDESKELDLVKTYSVDGNYVGEDHLRSWIGRETFAPDQAGEYDPKAGYDFLFAPDEKVSITDTFSFFRIRYDEEQDAKLEDSLGGIDNQLVGNVNVIQIFGDVPAPVSTVMWSTPSQAFASPFIPISAVVDSIPDAFGTDITEDANTEGSLQVEFTKLGSKLLPHREAYGSSFRMYLEGEETVSASDIAGRIRGEWNEKYASAPGEVIDEADTLLAGSVDALMDVCNSVSEDFEWYLIRNGVTTAEVAEENLVPFEIESSYVTIGSAKENGWNVTAEGDVIKAEKDGKTIEFTNGGEGEIKLIGFDTDSFIGDLFNGDDDDDILGMSGSDDDFVLELDDVESDDGLEIVLDENGELTAEETAVEGDNEAAEEGPAKEAEDAAAQPAEESAADAVEEKTEVTEEKTEAAEEKTEAAEEKTDAAAAPAADTPEIDTIAELQGYFNEKIASVPRNGWAENEIATELAGVSDDVSAILTKYIGMYYNKYVSQLSGDISDVDKIMNFDPAQAANDIATDVATDKDIAKAGDDIAQIGVFVSGLLGNYFNALAEDVSGDVVSGRLSQEGAVRILNEAAGDIEGVVNAYVGAATEKVAETAETIKESVPPKEDLKETLTEIDDALDVLDEYGVIDKDAIGLGEAKLADLAELTDADIDVVVKLDAMDDQTINGLSQLLGVDVRAALDQYIDRINAAGLGITINK